MTFVSSTPPKYDCEIFNENSNFNLNNINSKILRDSYSYHNIKENEKDLFD